MARYLIEHGADANLKKQYNDTNLILSVFREHVELVHYLVDELGCDVNESDDEKRSPLYLAVDRGSLALVQFLVSRGARNSPTADTRLTPLMLAAEKRRDDLMNAMISCYSMSEHIEAEELLGSACACREHGMPNLQKAVEHFSRALELRLTHQRPKSPRECTDDVFHHRQECQTIEQLNELRSNSHDVYIEALLIRDRLLGRTHPRYHQSMLQCGATLARTAQFQQGMVFCMYALKLQQRHGTLVHAKQLRYLVATFAYITSKWSPVSTQHFVQLISILIDKLDHDTEEFDFNLHTLLFLITMSRQALSQPSTTNTDLKTFYRLIHTINQKQYVTREGGSSLLHLSLNEHSSSTNSSINRICKYPCAQTVRALLHYGANVDVSDANGNTPLHVFVSNSNPLDESLFQLLCTVGSHLDYVNNLRKTPGDLTLDLKVKEHLQAKAQSSLKCLCARLIQRSRLPVHDIIASSLVTFVQRH